MRLATTRRIITKYILTVMSSILIGCSGCPDDGPENFLLSDFETSIIPFSEPQNVLFENESAIQTEGHYHMKLTEIIDVEFSDDEDCHPRNIESQSISLSLSNPNLELEIYLAKQVDDKTIFYINSGPTLFMINSCSQAMENLENVAREIVSNGFSFPNAFEFDNCSSEGNINKIIYSIDDGIVFIEFENGSYLKLL